MVSDDPWSRRVGARGFYHAWNIRFSDDHHGGWTFLAKAHNVPAVIYPETIKPASFWQAAYHMLTASMKGLVALTGLEAMSNGIQFVINEDAEIIQWGKQHLPKLQGVWNYYSGKAGIGRLVQTSFLFYGGI